MSQNQNAFTAGINTSSPTMSLKQIDTTSTPDIAEISDDDFKRYIYTGFSVKIDVPLVKNSRNALFAINIDGYKPTYSDATPAYTSFLKNFTPVQALRGNTSVVHIFEEMASNPIDFFYNSFRYISGNVGIGLRITSNTGQSGNLLIAQASGVERKYYRPSEIYLGLEALNTEFSPVDFQPKSFVLGDLSLNRNISISPIRRDPVRTMDLAQKQVAVMTLPPVPVVQTRAQIEAYRQISNQFLEDWILIGILSDLPGVSNSITISIFFDYSNVSFNVPLLPIIPMVPNEYTRQIKRVSDTLNTVLNPTQNATLFIAS